MANNRIFIKCKVCGEDALLAKYYPSTGWYIKRLGIKNLDWFFDNHLHKEDPGYDLMWGPTHFEMTYEQEDDKDDSEDN